MSALLADGRLEAEFETLLKDDALAIPVAAIQCLLAVIEHSTSKTMMELDEELRGAQRALLAFCAQRPDALRGRTAISVRSGSELFLRHATRTFLEFEDIDACRRTLLERGSHFAAASETSRAAIAEKGRAFVRDGSTVLVHGASP